MAGKAKVMLTKRKTVLVVAVHPDDETLGCGGTLLRHNNDGDDVYCIFCTSMKSKNGFTEEAISNRKKEIDDIKKHYKFSRIFNLDLDTTRVDEYSFSDLISHFSRIFSDIKPNIVYLPFMFDIHSDHRKVFEAAYSCTKSFRYPYIKKILMMETLSETEFAPSIPNISFVPNVYVDISPYMEKKIRAMNIYQSEISDFPFPRSEDAIIALAKYRGSSIGCSYAESFMLLKETLDS